MKWPGQEPVLGRSQKLACTPEISKIDVDTQPLPIWLGPNQCRCPWKSLCEQKLFYQLRTVISIHRSNPVKAQNLAWCRARLIRLAFNTVYLQSNCIFRSKYANLGGTRVARSWIRWENVLSEIFIWKVRSPKFDRSKRGSEIILLLKLFKLMPKIQYCST